MENKLPIFSFVIKHQESGRLLHHNFVCVLLNDLFGIQSRGGCACAGPYAQVIYLFLFDWTYKMSLIYPAISLSIPFLSIHLLICPFLSISILKFPVCYVHYVQLSACPFSCLSIGLSTFHLHESSFSSLYFPLFICLSFHLPVVSPFACRLSIFLSALHLPVVSPFACRLSVCLSSLRLPVVSLFACRLSVCLSSLRLPVVSPFACRLSVCLSSLRLPVVSPFACRLSVCLSSLRLPVVSPFACLSNCLSLQLLYFSQTVVSPYFLSTCTNPFIPLFARCFNT